MKTFKTLTNLCMAAIIAMTVISGFMIIHTTWLDMPVINH